MAILGVDNMKAQLVGGGARPNLFKVTMAFPSYVTADIALASYMCKAASMPASTITAIAVPFRGRNLQVAGDRTFDPWSLTVINDTDFKVVCDGTNNTGAIIDTNKFVADIYVKPARSINYITLNSIATRTGVEFSEIAGGN